MKKFLLVIITAALAATVLFFMASRISRKASSPVSAGDMPPDFVLGITGTRVIKLSNFTGKSPIVLVFLDAGSGSMKFENEFKNGLKKNFSDFKQLSWFNIKRDGLHWIIKGAADNEGLTYRARQEDVPKAYSFRSCPSAVAVDPSGTITLIYSGYSPTIFADIRASLRKENRQ
ncbi:MAG TPA: hypothetical protein P5511_02025 [Candidatus Goldiibacteriota bacterium]|nr:hypothetical protein [Candidatus Goldiibacteriota bacterium]